MTFGFLKHHSHATRSFQVEMEGAGSSRGKQQADGGKYVRYTAQQVEVLEQIYLDCPKPSSSKRQQIIKDFPILANIELKQIKVWFQNRRCREKQRKESSHLHTVNKKLSSMNKLLMQENDRLQRQVTQLVNENGFMQQQLRPQGVITDAGRTFMVPIRNPQPFVDVNDVTGLIAVAEATLSAFLGKATGTVIDWVQLPGMKPGPDWVGKVSISNNCCGVAARTCGLVSLEPAKIAEILNDRPTWLRDCRSQEMYNRFPTVNGGTIEVLHVQMYAPTTLAPARDFWSVRYSTHLDGCLVVCERSISVSGAGTIQSANPQFTRVEMLPSGFMIRPCEGGSIVHIVDHLNLEAWNVLEELQPFYLSPKVVAQRVTIPALRYIRQIAQETNGGVVYNMGMQPAVQRSFFQRLSRGFNDAVNGFTDDGWTEINNHGSKEVIIAVNTTENFITGSNPATALLFPGGVLCVKASMLLQNVSPALLVRFLREHRSEWTDFSVDAYIGASVKAGSYDFPGLSSTKLSGSQSMPLGHTMEQEEVLELLRLEGQTLAQDKTVLPRKYHLLQSCSTTDENVVGACSELVFAPIDENFLDEAPLLPSGFRIILLDTKTNSLTGYGTSHLASSLVVAPATTLSAANASHTAYNMRSVVTVAFQFPFKLEFQDSVATMALQYIRNVIASVQRITMDIVPSGLGLNMGPKLPPASPQAITISHLICQGYSFYFGTDLLKSNRNSGESVLTRLWNHPEAVLCFSMNANPAFTFANRGGLDILETTQEALHDLTLDKVFDKTGLNSLYAGFAAIINQGYACLPGGTCISTMGRHAVYQHGLAWKVVSEDGSDGAFAISLIDWAFV